MKKSHLIFCFSLVALLGVNLCSATVHVITANSTPTEGFVPIVTTAFTGDTIKWINGNGTHTTASTSIPTGAASWNSPVIGVSGFAYVVTVPGTYNYTCHPTSGGHMPATIVVTAAPSVSTISIPGDFSTIQTGIDAAISGDTVLVSPGTYFENINYNGKNIVVASLFITTGDKDYIDQTIIDGGDSSSVVSFINGEGPSALITGFTIRHGLGASWFDGNGGGIRCINSSPTIDNNLIDSNSVSFADGGGVYCENSSAVITNNRIIYNGGGYVNLGTGIACLGGSPLIAYNMITGSWGDAPNGIDLLKSSATIIHNTIVYNGNGIFVRDTSIVSIKNTIVWGNDNLSLYVLDSVVSNVLVTYSTLKGAYTGVGNVDINPVFTDTINNDFSLQFGSPCIDAGDPNSPNDPDGSIADMGALFFDKNVGVNNDPMANTQKNLKIYPNPTTGKFTIKIISVPELAELKIIGILGEEVYSQSISPIGDPYLHQLDMSTFSKGLYFITISSSDELRIQKIIIE